MTTYAAPTIMPRLRRARGGNGTDELHNGDYLTQPEFHRRYKLLPDGIKVELIGGIVHMASPTRSYHGKAHGRLAGVLVFYEAETPGVSVADNATTILGDLSEPQPDLHVRLLPECGGGRARIDDEGYVTGPPELVIEVAHSSEAIDLHAKREDYARAGVLEYVVACIREGALRGFDLARGRERRVDADGIYRSRVLPGLWIDADAVFRGDARRLFDVVGQGVASTAHAAFAKRLAGKSKPRSSSGKRSPRPKRRGH